MRFALIATVAASLALSSISGFATQAFAEKEKKIDPNMDIKKFYRDGDNLVMKVKGTAGDTVPEKPAAGEFGQVFVYVFHTDVGIMVINAHWECHDSSGCHPDESMVSEWHAEFVTVEDVDGFDKPCVTSIYGERTATVDGHLATVNVPEAHEITLAQTAAFSLQTNPDAPTQECIAEFDHLFDEMTPKNNQSDD
jgi:hypothetical protein